MKFPAFRTFSCSLGCEHMLARLLRVVLLGLILLGTGSARADVAELQYKRGIAYYEAKDYPRAIKAFQSAYKARQLPRILLNIGQVYRKLGMASTALKFYEHYLRVDPKVKPELRAEVDRYIAMTRAMLDPPPFESVDAKSAKAAAAEAVASAPSNVSAVPISEPYDVELGAKPSDAKSARPGEKGTDKLVPLSTSTQGATQTPPIASEVKSILPTTKPEPQQPSLMQPTPAEKPAQKPFYKQPLFWGVVGGAAAALTITGIAVGVSQANSIPATILYPTK